ncbi:C-5 cytosine methyltransferase [Moorella glycerini]|uniref:Cytosine-specific methyltransferase n=1 Tax=Neomoorella stamsii TaxID=1266720 RepID=A0A9X7J0F0_9FIRM|nr:MULTISPECIES: DNA cytosine methyltransferase [Moorella]PRR69612.1 putative BsuMI modification methylase subunit YdiP [Moorella stamsii]CEP68734.1 C-5 cytosine methyltransferase [Moorella glycerini]
MRVGSLFTGIGGFDLGFELVGMKVVWQVEIDQACSRVLEKHWPKVKRYGDIRTIKPAKLEPVDLICGGFPCQDLSVAGKRAGLAGERSGLFFEFVRIVAGLRPRWVVIENVLGLLSSNGGRDMGTVLWSLAKLGYGYAYRVLDAQYFGVAQRRRRVFIVGHLGKPWAAPAKVLFEPESCEGDSPPRRKTREVVASLLASGAGKNRPAGIASEVDFLVAYSLTSRCGQRLEPSSDTYVIQDEVYVRRLTPLECERLQGFPDNWTEGESDSARYKMLGNAVCVPVARWIGRKILEFEKCD